MTEAEAQFVAAVAELRRAEGLWRGPLTAAKKALLEQRLSGARTALAKSFTALRAQAAAPDPLPAAPTAWPSTPADTSWTPPNVVRLQRP
jgi:hypothetical protein